MRYYEYKILRKCVVHRVSQLFFPTILILENKIEPKEKIGRVGIMLLNLKTNNEKDTSIKNLPRLDFWAFQKNINFEIPKSFV